MSPSALKKPRQKKCKAASCREWFRPQNTLQQVCSPRCALELARAQQAKAERQQLRERKEKLKTRTDWIKEAQREFNKFIRMRDAREPCICCGRFADESWKPGGTWDAGHFLSVGARPELRFEELNCHKQLKSCNAGEGKYAGKRRTVSQGYKDRLPGKIGQKAYEWLVGPHEPKKYTVDDLKEIKEKYRGKSRVLESKL